VETFSPAGDGRRQSPRLSVDEELGGWPRRFGFRPGLSVPVRWALIEALEAYPKHPERRLAFELLDDLSWHGADGKTVVSLGQAQ
jgi:hypothetical protein